MTSYLKCCVPGCIGTQKPLHKFPNPVNDYDRFNQWVLSIGGDIIEYDNEFIYKLRRVCRAHFEEKYHCTGNRLSNIAVPTLNMPDFKDGTKFKYCTDRRPSRYILSSIKNTLCKDLVSSAEDSMSVQGTYSTTHRTIITYQNRYHTTRTQESKAEKENIDPLISASSFIEHLSDVPLTSKSADSHEHPYTKSNKIKIGKLTKGSTKTNESAIERKLYSSLLKTRVKLSKTKNRCKKLRISLETAKKLTSTAKILTLMQIRETKKKAKGHRFSNEEKILALTLMKQSPKAYKFLRKLIVLPAPYTLIKLLRQADIKPGINKKIFAQLKKQAENMKIEHRLCILLFDEISLKPNIAFNERKDNVVGFVTNGKTTQPYYADHAQVFMLRGLFKNYKQPISYTFSAAATKGAELSVQIKEIITEVQNAGFIIVATVCDQGTNNRQAIKLLMEESRGHCLRKGITPKDNVIIINGQEIWPLYDPPHLIKCVRNNFLNKKINYVKDNVTYVADWKHIEMLHKQNPGYGGLRLIPKLSDEHVYAHRIPKMKVKNATQTFSQTVGKTMGYLADKDILPIECKATANLLLFMDKLFDSINGSYGCNRHAKPLLGPVTPTSEHHKFWTEAIKILKSMKFLDSADKPVYNSPTLKNWVWTLENISSLLLNLKNEYSITSVWLRHFNQDPIENFFGLIRSHGCRNTNPTPEKFEGAFTTLLINSISNVHSLGANCQADNCKQLLDLIVTDIDNGVTPSASTCETYNLNNVALVPTSEKLKDPRRSAPLQYVTGYFVKKCKDKIYKNCNQCHNDLSAQNANEFISYREFAGRRWLFSPSDNFIEIISKIQDVTYSILITNLEKKNLKEIIKTLLLIYVDFNFNCEMHKDSLITFVINLSNRFFIFNYCKKINRTLCGKERISEENEDKFLNEANTYFNKHKKNKNT